MKLNLIMMIFQSICQNLISIYQKTNEFIIEYNSSTKSLLSFRNFSISVDVKMEGRTTPQYMNEIDNNLPFRNLLNALDLTTSDQNKFIDGINNLLTPLNVEEVNLDNFEKFVIFIPSYEFFLKSSVLNIVPF